MNRLRGQYFSAFLAILLVPLLVPGQARWRAQFVRAVGGKEIPVVAAWSSDARLAYGTEKTVPVGDVWQRRGEVYVVTLAGEKERILKHDYFRGGQERPFSFSVDRISWSPDTTKLGVELTLTIEEAATALFLFKSKGGELRIKDGANLIAGYGGAWLADNASLGMLEEALAPRLLHRVFVVRVEAGRMIPLFRPRTFSAVAWVPGKMQAVLVERDAEFVQAPKLLVGDLASGQVKELGEVPDYLGGLQATPDGERFSYFVGQNKLIVRQLSGELIGEATIPVGRYGWLGKSGAIAFLEPEELGKDTGWLAVWDPARQVQTRLIADERIRDFWLAPDGSLVAVLTADEVPELKIYRLESSSP